MWCQFLSMMFARPTIVPRSRLRRFKLSQPFIPLVSMGKPQQPTSTKRSVMKASKESAKAFTGTEGKGVAHRHRKEAMAGLTFLKAPKAHACPKGPLKVITSGKLCMGTWIPKNRYWQQESICLESNHYLLVSKAFWKIVSCQFLWLWLL